MNRDDIVRAIKEAAGSDGKACLTFQSFVNRSGLSKKQVLKHFDKWSDACNAAGVQISPIAIKGNTGPTRSELIADLQRVATILGSPVLSAIDYKSHGRWPSIRPVYRLFGTWEKAIEEAGLTAPSAFKRPIQFEELAREFLSVAAELGRIPSFNELQRRTRSTLSRFSRKYGGFAMYKAAIAEWYFDQPDAFRRQYSEVVTAAMALIRESAPDPEPVISPHRTGRILGFRQFAYAPTQEQDVVAIFNAVASELGFEILANRVRFPDCLARERTSGARAHYKECRIEFEFRSTDFRAHNHPVDGCDLIVCWEHNWTECPLRVLELRSEIQKLSGWQ